MLEKYLKVKSIHTDIKILCNEKIRLENQIEVIRENIKSVEKAIDEKIKSASIISDELYEFQTNLIIENEK